MTCISQKLKILFVVLSIIPLSIRAQFFNEAMSGEALRPFRDVYGINSSTFSLHNNSLLSRDISSTLENPAFLVNIRRPKACVSMQYLNVDQRSALADNQQEFTTTANTVRADYFGFAYPVPVYRGNMVFALSYTPSAYYYSSLQSKGTVTYDFGDVYQEVNIEETGSLNTLRIAGAIEFLPNFNTGISLNFHGGDRSYQSVETAIDENDVLINDKIINREIIKPNYNGFNMDVGLSYHSSNFKFGLKISTPLNLTIQEVSEFSEILTYDNAPDSTQNDYYDFEYESRYPMEIAPSFAAKFGQLTVGLDIIIHNWQKIEVDRLENKSAINRDLYWNLRKTTDIGVFLAMPIGNAVSTRLAYRRIPSPYENIQNNDDRCCHLYGAGIETILKKTFIIGCAYQRAVGDQTITHPYFDTWSSQKYTEDRLTVSMAVLF